MQAFLYVILGGYVILGRTFSYLGVAPLYPAELFMLSAFVFRGRLIAQVVTRHAANADIVFIFSLVFVGVGLLQTFRGIITNGEVVMSLKGMAGHYYVILFFVGMAFAAEKTERGFADMFWTIATGFAIYQLICVFLFPGINLLLPLATTRAVDLNVGGSGNSFIIVGTIALAPVMRRPAWIPVLLLFVTLLGPTPRATTLAVITGIVWIVISTRNPRLLVQIGLGIICIAVFAGVFGPYISFNAGARSGTLSLWWVFGRFIGSVDADLASSILQSMGAYKEAENIYALHGSGTWRLDFWRAILDSLRSETLWLFGHGYGVSLGPIAGHGADIRTPHNFTIYFIGYTGVIGLLSYLLLLLSYFGKFMALPKSPLRTFLSAVMIAAVVQAFFSNNFETPFFAVPFYLVLGLGYGLARFEVGTPIPPTMPTGTENRFPRAYSRPPRATMATYAAHANPDRP